MAKWVILVVVVTGLVAGFVRWYFSADVPEPLPITDVQGQRFDEPPATSPLDQADSTFIRRSPYSVEEQLDLNTATFSQIMTLPGMTPDLAGTIINYRQAKDYFESVYDLETLPGMTPDIFLQIKPLVRIEVPKTANLVTEMEQKLQRKLAESQVKDTGDYQWITFDLLSGFDYEYPEEMFTNPDPDLVEIPDQIPPEVKALSGKPVVIQGFMVPLDFFGTEVSSFILTNNVLLCCYGITPKINEWIYVKMEGQKTAKYVNNEVITVYGILDVGEEIKDGYLVGIYRMLGNKVETEF
ncbi:MAG: DUF3299 domain-containing protein [Gemmatimonadetes bacterium]|nr:MAG: DUF3299 domain-containing protein [Gemmatimonadota bacterium]